MAATNLIGHILVEQGYVNLAQLNQARRQQMERSNIRLEEILIEMGVLTAEQLEKGLELQAREQKEGE